MQTALTAAILLGSASIVLPATTAYVNPAGPFAPFDGVPTGLLVLGLDFNVIQPISVSSLGAYDYLQDGLFSHTIEVGIFDRDSSLLVGSSMVFSSASPGALDLGSRFKTLTTPIVLPAGFHGSVVAFGYSTQSSLGEKYVDEYNNNPVPQSVNTGGGLLSFVASRYDVAPALTYPTTLDAWHVHPANYQNQSMSGTFQFDAEPVPEASTCAAALVLLGLVGWQRWRRVS